MDTLKLQLDVKNNAQELQKYMLDLNNWEEEMKRKEVALANEKPIQNVIPPPRNKIKRSKPENDKKHSVKPKKISAYDYSAWDKFDVEKALADIDKEDDNDDDNEEEEVKESTKDEAEDNKFDESEVKDSDKFSLVDEAFYEKEMGNQFVKKEQWSDAIKCYTNAINLDSNNAIYYANRSLCFLKLKNFKSAETDATTAIQLDKKYVKAYQRRAYARLALGQLTDAKSDYEVILELEPKNALARVEMDKINEKLKKEQIISKPVVKAAEKSFNPKNMFKNEVTKSKNTQSINSPKPSIQAITASSKNETVLSKPKSKNTIKNITESSRVNNNVDVCGRSEEKNFERGDGDKVVTAQSNKQNSEVFRPLPEYCKIIQPIDLPPHKRSKKPLRRIEVLITDKEEDYDSIVEIKSECSKVVEEKEEKIVSFKKTEDEELQNERLSFDVPKTSIQFFNCWKMLRNNFEGLYSYLKNKIPANALPQIFENSLESDFFSQIVTFLARDEMEKDPKLIYDILLGLSNVKRFSSLILFMSEDDKKCVKKAVSMTEKIKSDEERSELLRLYELKA